MTYVKNYLKTLSIKSILKNIPFYISAIVTGFLFYLSTANFKSFVVYAITLLFISILVKFNPSLIKKHFSKRKLIVASVLPILIGAVFYHRMNKATMPINIANIVGIKSETLVLVVSALGALVSIYSFLLFVCFICDKCKISEAMQMLRCKISSYKNIKTIFIILFALYLLSYGAIMLADVPFGDDMQRIVEGESNYNVFSRHLSDLLSIFIHSNTFAVDVSPFPQIVATLIMTVASLIVVINFTDKNKISFANIFAVLPMGLTPFFLECISYKYDSPYMAISILASVMPTLFIACNPYLYIFTIILGVIISCSTYQAMLGIFPVMIILLVFTKWNIGEKFKEIFKFILTSAASYLAGILIYKVFIVSPYDIEAASFNYVTPEIFSLKDLPAGVFSNLKHFIGNIINYLDPKWLILISVIFASFIVLSCINSKRNKITSSIVCILALCAAICFCFGIYIFMIRPGFSLRSMPGFGAVIAIIAVICSNFDKAKLTKAVTFCFTWSLIVFCFAFGNLLQEQARNIDFRLTLACSDLNSIDEINTDKISNIEVKNISKIQSYVFERNLQFNNNSMQILTNSYWSSVYFNNFFGIKNRFTIGYNSTSEGCDDISKYEVVKDTYYHTIYMYEDNIIIFLKDCG